ncbi:MAG TPA: type II secretion system protein GspM [Rhodocyclaceae bacterium]|nr:type II secretion system protein GspM [Rhodocyclaceae bacterium]
MIARSRPAFFSVGLTLSVLLLAVVLAAGFLVSRSQWASDMLASIEPRHARLQGLKAQDVALQAAFDAAAAQIGVLTYGGDQSTERVGTDLQQKIRAVAASAGFSVVGSQIMPARLLDGFEEVPVSITLEGALEHLGPLLDELAVARPLVKVVSLNLVPMRGRGVTAQRNLRLDLSVASVRALP